MDNTIAMPEWVRFIGAEYLYSFIKDGGASVKFAVMDEERIPDLASALAAQSESVGCIFTEVNAADSRVHMPQDVFFAISQQLDWRLLSRRAILALANDAGYLVDDIDPSNGGNIYANIAKANLVDASSVLRELRPAMRNQIATNRSMARDFRVAMTHLCVEENINHDDAYNGQPLIEWLTGANTRISNVRHFSVHTPINRTTARHFMESAFYWIRYAGYSGVVLFLDNTRILLNPPRPRPDNSRYYTRAMVLDHYELVRELIDSCDRLRGALVVIATSTDFLDETHSSRGFRIYEALMTRVMNDVRDRNLVNPMASLVRLS